MFYLMYQQTGEVPRCNGHIPRSLPANGRRQTHARERERERRQQFLPGDIARERERSSSSFLASRCCTLRAVDREGLEEDDDELEEGRDEEGER